MDWRDRILKLIKDRGFKTRNDLCIKAGISAGSLNMALNGTHELKLSTMGKLANALGTTTRWLLYGDDIVEARQVPLLLSRDIKAFILAGKVSESCPKVQIGHDLKVSGAAYAWKNYQDDMHPHFTDDDILIIDPCNPDDLQPHKFFSVMTASGFCKHHTNNLGDCLKEGEKIRFYISNMVNLSSEYYFETLHDSCAPKPFLFPSPESDGQFNIPIGVVVQLIRTFVQR